MAKRWHTIPSEIRWKCINALENDRKIRRIPTIDYVMLGTCIDYLMKKITQIDWLDELSTECPKKIAAQYE